MKEEVRHLLRMLPVAGIFTCMFTGCGPATPKYSDKGATSPEKALSTFQLEDGFQIELLASEPLIASPVDMEIDEYGRLYVVEMPGYPLDKSGTGVIKLLSDTDGDGKMDHSVVFADGLVLPNGILRWKKGVIVTDAPNVLYLEDSDGDGHADIRDTLLTGFSLSNPHVNVNNPIYGLDNWVYLSHLGAINTRKYGTEFGDKGSEIRFPGLQNGPRLPQNAESRSVRFQPDAHKLEMLSGKSQFGHTFDQWGHHFLTHNQNHIYQEVIAAPYLKRNPDMQLSNATESISDHGNACEVFQITKNPDRQLFTPTGLTTSSSGITAYEGGLFPAPFNDKVTFVAESVSNLVHVDMLTSKGASFEAKRNRPDKEFLASTDAWSRPVNMYVGPDGALYVLDYYRRIIEHPEWMSDEAVKAGGLYDGYDMGRIYRITPKGTKHAEWTKGLQLGKANNAQLVTYLAHENMWWRLNAQRLLVDRQDKNVAPLLTQLIEKSPSPAGRLHALWTLEGIGALNQDMIKQGLKDTVAGVRENAIKLAELHLTDMPGLQEALLSMQQDTDPRVRFQLLCTLGFINTNTAAIARQKLMFQDIDDKWVQIAALSAAASEAAPLLQVVLKRFDPDKAAYASLVERLSDMVAAGHDTALVKNLIKEAISQHASQKNGWQAPALTGITEGLKRKQGTPLSLQNEKNVLIATCFDHPVAAVRSATLQLLKVTGVEDTAQLNTGMKKAATIAQNKTLPEQQRAEAAQFMTLGDAVPYIPLLERLITTQEETSVQLAALKILGQVPGPVAASYVLQQWETLTPEIRDAALNIFMPDSQRIDLLLRAVESGKVKKSAIGWTRSVQLMGNSKAALRDRARALFTKDDKEKVNREYRQALQLEGNIVKGKAVYQQNCALCHQVRGKIGVSYGPDLGTVHNWLPQDLMANILDPSLSIAPGFDLWEITLKDGGMVQGMIMNETSAAISLRTAPGIEKTISRQEIQSIKGLNMSVMPVLTNQVNYQQMADLLAFLRNSNDQQK